MAELFSYHLIAPGDRVLCAVSGGADSMYLLCRLLDGASRGGYQVGAAHFHHGIRQASDGEEDFVRAWCERHQVPLHVGHGHVPAAAAQRGQGVEETARALRYAFLYDTARREGYTLIATGHHAGDQAETVLMHLIRGSGLQGLRGIQPRQGMLIRPMLEVTREQVEDYLRRRHVPHVEDESNADPAYTRNRMRHQVLPLLFELNPQAVHHIAQAAAKLREDAQLLDTLAQAVPGVTEGPEGVAVDISQLLAQPRPLVMRRLAQVLTGLHIHPSQVYLDGLYGLMAQAQSGARLDLPGYVARKSWNRLDITPVREEKSRCPVPLRDGYTPWGEWRVECRTAICPQEKGKGLWLVPGDYVLRPREVGDTLQLPKRPTKTVKKLMIEKKIPSHLRPRLPVVAQGERVAAVALLGVDQAFLAQPGQPARSINVTKENEDHA